MDTLYYVKPRDEELGPLTFAQLRSMWSRGDITVKTPFRFEEEENWQTLAVLRRELESGGPPPPLPGVNQAPAQPSLKRSNVGGCGCLVVLLVGIAVFALSNRGPSPEEEAATAKRQRDQDAAISASLRQEVANAKTTQEKLRAVEKLLKHEPGNLDMQNELQNTMVQCLKEELVLPKTPASRKVQILNELIAREPTDQQWQLQLKDATKVAKRQQAIEQQFSAWDGSHHELVEAVKAGMNDPDSFKHVTTRYWDMKTHLVISMTFRGSNAFGGIITKTVKAKSPIEGGKLEIMESY